MLDLALLDKKFRERYPRTVSVVDSYTAGEPTRLIVGGVGPLPGATMKDKLEAFRENHDPVRGLLTREPRGHRGILAAMITRPVTPGADFGLIYMDARRYPFLCGHATIGAVTTLIELGLIPAEGDEVAVTVDTPSGPMKTRAFLDGDKVASVAYLSVPSFVYETDQAVDVPGFGTLPVDTVCVGGFFAMVSAGSLGFDPAAGDSSRTVELGMAVIAAANEQLTVCHPERPEVRTVDVTEFYKPFAPGHDGAGWVVYGESHMDRSPCGTGTAAKLTLFHHRGLIAPGEPYRNHGPLGTAFEGRIALETRVGDRPAVVVEVRGSAHTTGRHEFVLDPADPFPEGYLL